MEDFIFGSAGMEGMRTVIIDAGHGGQEPGAVFEGRREKDDTLQLALKLGGILENEGVRVLYTRTTDVYQNPNVKAEIGNRSDADFFISIHRNAMPVPGTGSGALSLIYENGGEAEQLARNIQQALTDTGFADLGIQERPGLAVLSRTRMPAVLVEAGFIDNPADNQFFDQNLDAIAQAIADGVVNTFQEMEQPVHYQIQTGAFRDPQMASRLEEQLRIQGFPVFVIDEDGWFKVRVGSFLSLDNAVNMEQQLRQYGYPTVMVRA